MAEIRGYATHAAGAELLAFRYSVDDIRADEVEVRISHCGVCRSDLHLIDNDWTVSKYPFVPGHEIIGTISEVGSAVHHLKPGDRVGVGWQANSCGHCAWCRGGQEHLCAEAQPTCVHRHGGFAEAVRVSARFAVPIPEALSSQTAAPLLCAGVTVYTPMRTYGVSPASRVGVVGIGGLGHVALQFANVFGAEVTAFSSSHGKEEEAKSFGAHHYCNTRESKNVKALGGSFDLILSSVHAEQDWTGLIGTLRPAGVLCLLGAPARPLQLPAAALVLSAKAVAGSNTGSPLMIAEMLDVAARHKVAAQVECYPMARINEAIGKVRRGTVRYRAVLSN